MIARRKAFVETIRDILHITNNYVHYPILYGGVILLAIGGSNYINNQLMELRSDLTTVQTKLVVVGEAALTESNKISADVCGQHVHFKC